MDAGAGLIVAGSITPQRMPDRRRNLDAGGPRLEGDALCRRREQEQDWQQKRGGSHGRLSGEPAAQARCELAKKIPQIPRKKPPRPRIIRLERRGPDMLKIRSLPGKSVNLTRGTSMTRHPFSLSLLLIAATSSAVYAQTGKGQQFAFLVACSKYEVTELKPLPYSYDEMKDFRTALIRTGYSPDNIKFMRDRQLTDDEYRFLPEKAKILKEFKVLLARVGPEDSLLVALNGHGLQFKGDRTGFFCPLDARVSDKANLIPLDGVGGIFELLQSKSCKAKRKLLIVNACRNDPTSNVALAGTKIDLVDDYAEEVPPGIAALYSCQKGQRSYYYPESQKRHRSLFFHHLIEAWNGRYVRPGEKVTIDHVFQEVARKTSVDADKLFGEAQVPQPKRLYEGEWIVTAVPVPMERSPDLPAATLHTNASADLLERILNSLNVTFSKSAGSTTTYRFALQGQQVRLSNFGGSDLMMDASFSKANLQAINNYNVDRKFIRAVAYNRGAGNEYTALESNLDCVGGVSEEMIRTFIANFAGEARDFAAYLAKQPVESAPQLFTSISNNQVEQILRNMNIQFQKNVVSDTETAYNFNLDGQAIRLTNYGSDLMVDARWRKAALSTLNQYNYDNKFIRTVAYNRGANNEYTALESNLDCVGGVTEERIRAFITVFPSYCRNFASYLNGHP
jgi:hypothetical protein